MIDIIQARNMLRCGVSDDGERCSACLRLQEVQSKIRECEELLNKLYMQEAQTKSSVNAVHDPIIRNLPLELVSNILALCNPSPVETDEEFTSSPLPNAPLSTLRYQFSLGTVCKTWRNIVRSTPQLWTNIYIRFPTKRGKLPQKELLLSLRLSGSLPLHITAWMRRGHQPSAGDYLVLSPLVEMLNAQSERWKILDLNVTARLLSQFKGGASGAPILERLRIYLFGPPSEIKNEFHVSFGLPSPQIVDAHRTSFSFIGISWKGVTRVKIDTLTATECLGLFQLATQLVNLNIGLLECGDFHLSNSGEVITASNLASWEVKFSANSEAMLNKLVLPSLVDLQVMEFISLESNSLEHLVSRSNCPLRTISLYQAAGDLDVIPLLRVTPLVEKLVFSNATSSGIHELLDILARTKLVNDISEDPNMMFLPHLENLSFIGVQDGSPPWHVVPSLFPPTWHPANSQYRPLRRLEFCVYTELEVKDHLDKDVLLQLREIQQRHYDLIILNEGAIVDVDLIQASYDLHFGSRISSDDNSGVEGGEEVDKEGIAAAAG